MWSMIESLLKFLSFFVANAAPCIRKKFVKSSLDLTHTYKEASKQSRWQILSPSPSSTYAQYLVCHTYSLLQLVLNSLSGETTGMFCIKKIPLTPPHSLRTDYWQLCTKLNYYQLCCYMYCCANWLSLLTYLPWFTYYIIFVLLAFILKSSIIPDFHLTIFSSLLPSISSHLPSPIQ